MPFQSRNIVRTSHTILDVFSTHTARQPSTLVNCRSYKYFCQIAEHLIHLSFSQWNMFIIILAAVTLALGDMDTSVWLGVLPKQYCNEPHVKWADGSQMTYQNWLQFRRCYERVRIKFMCLFYLII